MRTSFRVEGRPAPQGSKQVWRGRVVEMSPRLAEWRQRIAWAAAAHQVKPVDGPVEVWLGFQFARPKSHLLRGQVRDSAPAAHTFRPDLDKLARAALDGLVMGSVLVDDSQVTRLVASKEWSGSGWVGMTVVVIS